MSLNAQISIKKFPRTIKEIPQQQSQINTVIAPLGIAAQQIEALEIW